MIIFCWKYIQISTDKEFDVTIDKDEIIRELDKKEQIMLMEQAIKTLVNQQSCQNFPNLPLKTPEIMKFLLDVEPINCGDKDDWVSCDLSICTIKDEIIAKKGPIECEFADIKKSESDFLHETTKPVKSTKQYVLKNSDFAHVKCVAKNKDSWSGLVIGIRNDESLLKKKSLHKQSQLNVLMLGFDSMSRNAFIRKLPKSFKYLTNNLNGHVLEGYNIVGEGTPQALIPLLTGSTELELPEIRKRRVDADYVDILPFIWKEYEKLGYVTAFNEDQPGHGTFTRQFNGFKDQPTNHYMRPYFLAIERNLNSYKKLCVGSQPRHRVFLDYTKAIMMHYSQPRFVFSFHSELSHESINMIGVADKDLVNWLESIENSGILNNTVLILMSDHGNRFEEVRNTLQGRQEERLPFFSFTFPEWFKTEFQNEYANFKKNLNRLTTPFDIHATLQHILHMQQNKSIPKPLHPRSISLFNEIPENRSCSNAYIEPQWCSCHDWQPLNETQDEVLRIANKVVDFINKYTHPYRSLCEQLRLDKVLWAGKLEPQESILQFNESVDEDSKVKSKAKIENELYQVKVLVEPSKAIYEASLFYNLQEKDFTVKLSDITRINKYWEKASLTCIYEVNPELRRFCYCRD